jgi:iron complex transport system substrate-binding protein
VDFKAFKEKHILYCNQGQQPYYENMPTEPEILLADFVKAFHPELLPDYQPKYYRLLTK